MLAWLGWDKGRADRLSGISNSRTGAVFLASLTNLGDNYSQRISGTECSGFVFSPTAFAECLIATLYENTEQACAMSCVGLQAVRVPGDSGGSEMGCRQGRQKQKRSGSPRL